MEQLALLLFIVVPFVALLAAVPLAWGWGVSWLDLGLMVFFYFLGCHGITIGFHRYFTHGSFKAKRPLRIALAVAGSMAVEGPLVRWVADHRKHHRFSDAEGDPHSRGSTARRSPALLKGLWWAHMAWMFDEEQTPQQKYAPDLIKDPAIRRISRQFVLWTLVSLGLPPLIGGLVTMSWWGAFTAFFWASSSGWRCCTTSPGRSTRSATRSASARSSPGTARATSGGWPSSPAASRGTTCTTPTRPRPGTASSAARSTPRRGSSAGASSWGGPTTCGGPRRSASTPAVSRKVPTRHDGGRGDRLEHQYQQ